MALINTLAEFTSLAQALTNGSDAIDGLSPATFSQTELDQLRAWVQRLIGRADALGSVDPSTLEDDVLAGYQQQLQSLQSQIADLTETNDRLRQRIAIARAELRLLAPDQTPEAP